MLSVLSKCAVKLITHVIIPGEIIIIIYWLYLLTDIISLTLLWEEFGGI